LDDGLLIYYSWDSTFLDQSHNNFDPLYVDANFAEDRNGNTSNAIYFNGINNFISLPDSYILRPPFPLSFAFWFKLDDLSPEHGVLFDNDYNEFTHSGVKMNISSSQRLGLAFGNGGGFYLSARKTFLTDVHLEAERWYFATGVIHNRFDLRIFINGEEQNGFFDGSAEDMVYVGEAGHIGKQDANYQLDPYYFKGYMDEFRYWNRGLSNEEVKILYEGETLSVEEASYLNDVSVYPNPTKDWLNIKTVVKSEFTVDVFDQYGKLCNSDANVKKIDLSSLSNGLYVLQIKTTNGQQFIEKIIKQ
jgi:hypothetical protein